MKLSKLLLFALIASTGVLFTACDNDDDESPAGNEVTINILEPAAGEVITDATDVHVHIEIEATDENHEVEIILHPEGNVDDKIIDFDKHEHDQKIVFEQDVNLSSYPAGTEFHLEVEACVDHDCEEKSFGDVEFSIQ